MLTYEFLQNYWWFLIALLGGLLVALMFVQGGNLHLGNRALSETHLLSSNFEVQKEGDRFILHGSGWGHGVGLCQIGAAVMGEKGYDYDDILLYYYRGAEIKQIY